jgi:hypothetical protein
MGLRHCRMEGRGSSLSDRYAGVETSYTALANGRNKVEERLSRWLLLADDRIDSNALPLTMSSCR